MIRAYLKKFKILGEIGILKDLCVRRKTIFTNFCIHKRDFSPRDVG